MLVVIVEHMIQVKLVKIRPVTTSCVEYPRRCNLDIGIVRMNSKLLSKPSVPCLSPWRQSFVISVVWVIILFR